MKVRELSVNTNEPLAGFVPGLVVALIFAVSLQLRATVLTCYGREIRLVTTCVGSRGFAIPRRQAGW